MSTSVLPLSDIARRLAEKQSELEVLQRAYEGRLTVLQRRKEELEASLRQVDAEIRAASRSQPAPTPLKPTPPPTVASGTPSLPQLLVAIVRERGRPITVKELSDELVARKFPTSSTNLPKMVGSRVLEMIRGGKLSRAAGQDGVVLPGHKLAHKGKAAPAPKSKSVPAASKKSSTNGQAAPAARSAAAAQDQPPLHDILTKLLAASKHPLKARELAEQVLAGGYKTTSKTFVNVVWTALGNMRTVENISGKGYRLKANGSKSK